MSLHALQCQHPALCKDIISDGKIGYWRWKNVRLDGWNEILAAKILDGINPRFYILDSRFTIPS